MATKTYQFTGVAQWAKVHAGQADDKFPTIGDNSPVYSIQVKLDAPSEALFADSGLRLKVKDGYRTFRRPDFKTLNGLKVVFGPVPVQKGQELYTGLIGNGSNVTVKVEVYDSKFGKGGRLMGVLINDLVEYKPVNDGSVSSGNALPF